MLHMKTCWCDVSNIRIENNTTRLMPSTVFGTAQMTWGQYCCHWYIIIKHLHKHKCLSQSQTALFRLLNVKCILSLGSKLISTIIAKIAVFSVTSYSNMMIW